MFTIEYEKYGHNQKIVSNDVKDIRDIIIGIANDNRTEDEAYKWACNANFGDSFVNQRHKFSIKCVYNENNVYSPDDSRNEWPDVFRSQRKLQVVADKISGQTGVSNKFIGNDNDSLTWDFDIGMSYMKNNAGNGLFFALNNGDGTEICTVSDVNVQEFIRKTVTVIKRLQYSRGLNNNIKSLNKTKIMRNQEILNHLKEAKTYNKEWHARIYDDGCWWIDIERYLYGQIKFWVGFEDKRSGNSNGSIFSIYRYNGEIKYSCDFIVKQRVADKIKSIFIYLENNGII